MTAKINATAKPIKPNETVKKPITNSIAKAASTVIIFFFIINSSRIDCD